jgi:excinuclease UvrABC nuclease subunit
LLDLRAIRGRRHALIKRHHDVSADGARYFGPFRSTRIVNATLELIQKVFPIRTCTRSLPPASKPSDPCLRYHLKRCPGPCRGELSAEAAEAYNAARDSGLADDQTPGRSSSRVASS